VLEGIYRGLKMDHVVLAMTDPRQTRLAARLVLGDEREQWLQRFQLALDGSDNLFKHVMGQNEPVWMDKRMRLQLAPLLGEPVQSMVGGGEFLLAPLRVQGQVRGIIYADRQPGATQITEQEFLSFRHFCEHANLGFQLLAGENRKG